MFICDIKISFSIKCISHILMTSWINDAYVIRYTHGWFKSFSFGRVVSIPFLGSTRWSPIFWCHLWGGSIHFYISQIFQHFIITSTNIYKWHTGNTFQRKLNFKKWAQATWTNQKRLTRYLQQNQTILASSLIVMMKSRRRQLDLLTLIHFRKGIHYKKPRFI